MFLTRAQTQALLQADPDGFIGRLGPLDLKARRCRTRAEYMAKAINSAGEWSPEEKDLIWRQVQLVQEFMETTIYSGLQWKFAKASYEDGLPHTRDGVIFLTGPVSSRTLVHEIVHVNQKLRGPNIPPGYILTREKIDNLRANPDTDGKVWYKDGVPADSYFGPNPQSISDAREFVRHPFEAEAYIVDAMFSRA